MGGTVIVQDPSDADFPQMPRNALSRVPADYVSKLSDIGPILDQLARSVPQAETKRNEGYAT
jgi:two-component system chemotaxis response regulator CheB